MSSTYAFINNQTASYNSIKNRINLSNEGRKRFDRLNQHLSIDGFVTPGQIVIVGSDSKFDITDSCTLDEASADAACEDRAIDPEKQPRSGRYTSGRKL
jgi:hypothetical protein